MIAMRPTPRLTEADGHIIRSMRDYEIQFVEYADIDIWDGEHPRITQYNGKIYYYYGIGVRIVRDESRLLDPEELLIILRGEYAKDMKK